MLRLSAFRNAWNGVIFFMRREKHARVHLIFASISLLLGVYLKLANWEWVGVLFSIGLVISAEIINSSIERLTDLVSLEITDMAKIVKDLAAAAVLFCAAIATTVGLIIFVPRLYNLF